MTSEQESLHALIAGLEAQRRLLGDAVIDAALVPLHSRLGALQPDRPTVDAIPDQTLRLVTVLIVDMIASTELGLSLDPEETHDVLDGAMVSCTQVLAEHGGRVLQYAGDGLLAVFGAEESREDDAERAVRAGLAILSLSATGIAHGSPCIAFRIGAHTGRVSLGGGIDKGAGIKGIHVNLAKRMEQSAPPSRLRISHDTYRLIRGVFDVEPQQPLNLKGFKEPVLSYLVQRAKARAFRVATRGIEGIETRMIGRHDELERLRSAFVEVFRTRRLVDQLVVAGAGVGKSRLLYEFENWAEGRPETFVVYRGRAVPQTQSQPYGLLRDILAWRMQIVDSDSMDIARTKLEKELSSLFLVENGSDEAEAEAQMHLLGHLVGLDYAASRHLRSILGDGVQIRNRAFAAATTMFRQVAAQRSAPVVLLLEDLHWADDGSLDFLDYLVEVNADVAMLIVGLTRPALFEGRTPRIGDRPDRRIDMMPLDVARSGDLADELLQKLTRVPAELRAVVIDTADGNPFFMEELVKMLIDEGAIGTGPDGWDFFPGKLSAKHVPQTLIGVVQARLDRLQPEERLALQQASVIGSTFWDRALAAVDPCAIDALPGLTRRELVAPHPGGIFHDAREFSFQHQILHQVTYDTVLKRLRRQYHAAAAAWLAAQFGARTNDFLAMTAEHFREAGDSRQACEFFTRAAESARSRHAHDTTLALISSALELIEDAWPESDSLRWRLLDVRERTFDLQARRADQLADIVALQVIADGLDDDARRSEAAWRRCDLAFRTGDFPTMEHHARIAMVLGQKIEDDTLRLRGQQRVAGAVTMLGDSAAGHAMALAGLAEARALGLRATESLFLSMLNMIASIRDDLGATWNRQALLVDRELGNMRFEARDHCNIGISSIYVGDHDDAELFLAEGLRLTRLVGDRHAELHPLVYLSTLARRRDANELACAHAQSAVDIALELGSPDLEVAAFMAFGHARLAVGAHPAAFEAFARAHRAASEVNPAITHDASAGMAAVALATGDAAAALAALGLTVRAVLDGGSLEGSESPRLILLTCYQVLSRSADPRAGQFLDKAHANLQARAGRIADAGGDARRFVDDIPEHRKIVRAWNHEFGDAGRLRSTPGEAKGD